MAELGNFVAIKAAKEEEKGKKPVTVSLGFETFELSEEIIDKLDCLMADSTFVKKK